ncbi:hypothetical protein J2S43_006018 [Catenuloplanes nepalensis]|uniref:Uncharacterized protein n=1 Tax=Catenuloplanes nepalensis TaxID=587533 RepID=A0ABT9N239_9ACTN|nr:Hsp70 family protein [Catenuloplanes nepalensis]MDP9797506.1 hypothetical protein [Catenuloplanes nepalensis]
MTEPILAVDVGTSGTSAALIVGDQTTLLKEPLTGGFVWPSAVCVDDDGFVVGTAAERRKRSVPRRYIDGPRRAVDAQASMRLDDREVTGNEAVAAYLAELGREAQRVYGGQVWRLTLSIPAGYLPGDPRRDAMVAIGEAAGFVDVELIPDAVAAALDPHTGADLRPGSLVLVCDLGANWTASLVRVAGNDSALLATQSSTAGHDLEALLIKDLRTEGRTWLEPLLAAPGDGGLRAYYEAIDFVRRLKHQLGDSLEVEDHLTPLTPPYKLSRAWLEAFAEPAVQALVASAHAVVGAVGATLADISSVVLSGGASRLPVVKPALANSLGHTLRHAPEPELAVVRGAAQWAANAESRAVAADAPSWRLEPISWDIPGGDAKLLRWNVGEGEAFREGTVVAEVRTGDERVYQLTATHAGALLSHTVPPGGQVGSTLVTAATRDAAALAADPPTQRLQLRTSGSWLLTPDRQVLVECDTTGRHIRSFVIATGELIGEFRPDFGAGTAQGARIFFDPEGRLSLIAWDTEGTFSVWDVETGKLSTRFRDSVGPVRVLVDEPTWRLAAEADGKVQVGRYRRGVTTLWDLRTGERLERTGDETWEQRNPGFRMRSPTDAFNTESISPDGRLRALVTSDLDGSGVLSLQDIESSLEVFRVHAPAAPEAEGFVPRLLTSFTADGKLLLANWDYADRSLVDAWEM